MLYGQGNINCHVEVPLEAQVETSLAWQCVTYSPLLSCPPFNHELVRHLYIGTATASGSKKVGASDLVLLIQVSNESMTCQRIH